MCQFSWSLRPVCSCTVTVSAGVISSVIFKTSQQKIGKKTVLYLEFYFLMYISSITKSSSITYILFNIRRFLLVLKVKNDLLPSPQGYVIARV